MSRGNSIIVSSHATGRRERGIISAALQPGVIVQIKSSSGISDNGQYTFEAYNADADGGRPKGPLYILCENEMMGQLMSEAYAADDQCFVIIPQAGEEYNMILGDVSGTGDDHTKGEMLIVDDTTGELIATTGSPETECFQLLETVTDPTADSLRHVKYTGY